MAHGGLLAVIGNESWCQPPGNGLTCTLLYLFPPLGVDISLVLVIEIKQAAKPTLGQSLKKRRKVYALHLFLYFLLLVVSGEEIELLIGHYISLHTLMEHLHEFVVGKLMITGIKEEGATGNAFKHVVGCTNVFQCQG